MCRVYPSSKCHRAELLLSCKVDGWILHYGFYAQSVCRNCIIISTLPLQFMITIFITLKRSSIPLHSRDKCASVVTICVRPAILVASTMPTTHVRTTADTMTLRLQKTKNAHRFANPNRLHTRKPHLRENIRCFSVLRRYPSILDVDLCSDPVVHVLVHHAQ